MVAMAIYSVTMVLWKETVFPLCRATERRWKMNFVPPGVFSDSGDTPANLLCYFFIIIIIFKPTSTKPQAEKLG